MSKLYNAPRLAVIVPVFNDLNFFKTKVQEAMLVTTLFPVTYYFVDDGSTTPLPFHLYKDKSDFVFLKHKSNQGLFMSRQTGLKRAVADRENTHFLFSDVDDRLFCNGLVKAFVNIRKFPRKVQLFSFSFASKFQSPSKFKSWKIKVYKGKTLVYSPHMPTFVISRCETKWFLSDIKYHSAFEDFILAQPFFIQNYKNIITSFDPLYQKVLHKNSITHSSNTNLDDLFKALSIFLKRMKNYPDLTQLAFVICRDILTHVFFAFQNENYSLVTQWKISLDFLKGHFSNKTICSASHKLGFVRTTLWVLLKWRLFFIVKIIFWLRKTAFQKLATKQATFSFF